MKKVQVILLVSGYPSKTPTSSYSSFENLLLTWPAAINKFISGL